MESSNSLIKLTWTLIFGVWNLYHMKEETYLKEERSSLAKHEKKISGIKAMNKGSKNDRSDWKLRNSPLLGVERRKWNMNLRTSQKSIFIWINENQVKDFESIKKGWEIHILNELGKEQRICEGLSPLTITRKKELFSSEKQGGVGAKQNQARKDRSESQGARRFSNLGSLNCPNPLQMQSIKVASHLV